MQNKSLGILMLSLVAMQSCGVMGQKEERPTTVTFRNASSDCLSGLAPKIQSFLNGDISAEEWEKVWACTNQSLDSFRRFVDPSDPRGFTQEDMKALIGQFLLSRQEISEELVRVLFELKASVVGGSTTWVTRDEISLLQRLVTRFQQESAPLIPLLKARRRAPSPQVSLDLADAIAGVGEKLAQELVGESGETFSRSSAELLVDELARLNVVALPAQYTGVAFAFKEVLFAGSKDRIEGRVWPELIRTAGRVIGIFAGIQSLPQSTDQLDFREQIAQRIYDLGLLVINRNHGKISFQAIDSLIAELPDSVVRIKTNDGRGYVLDRGAIQRAMRPLMEHVLGEREEGGISQDSLETLYRLFLKWSRGERHLVRIFKDYGLDTGGVSAERFAAAAGRYQVGMTDDERSEVGRLVDLAYDYKPLFLGEDDQISFIPSNRHSLSNLKAMHWINVVATHALAAYGSFASGTQADLADLDRLVQDFLEIADELKIVDSNQTGLTRRRFGEADLFMPTSNGDGLLDEREVTYYIAFLKSAFGMAQRVLDVVKPLCQLPGNPQENPDLSDYLYWRKMDGPCFRREYFSRYASFWDHLPAMVTYYRVSSADQRQAIAINLEKAGRRMGYSDSWFGSYDTQGLGATLQFVESIFTRFDADNNQELDLDETMTAYPIFRPIFARVGNIDADDPKKERLLRTAFTFTIQNGEKPPTITMKVKPKVQLKTEGPVAKFGLWFLKGYVPGAWKVDSQRDRLYNIVTLLAGPGSSPQPPAQAPETVVEWFDPQERY